MKPNEARELILSGNAPANMTVNGYLDLSGCTGITSIPDNLTVSSSLDLRGCTGLTSLPENLTVNGWLDLRGCTGLTSLPENLTVSSSLYLRVCTGITSLPENLTVGGSFSLGGCTGITSIPDNLTVSGSLYLNGCTGLTSIPDNLTVSGSLYLDGCTGLTSLPENLTVGWSLYLHGCTGLTSLPENLTVGGFLGLGGCTGLLGTKWRGRELAIVDGYAMALGRKRNIGDTTIQSAWWMRNIKPGADPKSCYVASQGEHSAHGDTIEEAIRDLRFKIAQEDFDAAELIDAIRERGTVRRDDFRLITGACAAGLREGMAQAGLDPDADELPLDVVMTKAHGSFGDNFRNAMKGI